jgi:isopenicillin N synthase-like dioxygenase
MVLQHERYGSGLQVLNANGQWIPAPTLPGASFTCEIGNYLPHLADGRLVSTVHRVVNNSGRKRISLPFFFSPDPSAVLVPVVADGETRKSEVYPFEKSSVGQHFCQQLLHARQFHATAKRVAERGIPAEEWKYEFLTGGLP